jgi:hypothetical protein
MRGGRRVPSDVSRPAAWSRSVESPGEGSAEAMRSAPRERFRVYSDAEFLLDAAAAIDGAARPSRQTTARGRLVGVALIVGAIGSVGAVTGTILLATPRHTRAARRMSGSVVASVRSSRDVHNGPLESGRRSRAVALPVRQRRHRLQQGPRASAVVGRHSRPRSRPASRRTGPAVAVRPTATVVRSLDAAERSAIEAPSAAHAINSAAGSTRAVEFGFER